MHMYVMTYVCIVHIPAHDALHYYASYINYISCGFRRDMLIFLKNWTRWYCNIMLMSIELALERCIIRWIWVRSPIVIRNLNLSSHFIYKQIRNHQTWSTCTKIVCCVYIRKKINKQTLNHLIHHILNQLNVISVIIALDLIHYPFL